jgi:hypothetical protein
MALQPLWTLAAFSVVRPLPTHRTTQTQNKRTDIHASRGIRTHYPSVRAGEDGSCLRPRGHCDKRLMYIDPVKLGVKSYLFSELPYSQV